MDEVTHKLLMDMADDRKEYTNLSLETREPFLAHFWAERAAQNQQSIVDWAHMMAYQAQR